MSVMNEEQFKLVKTFLAFPFSTPRKLATAWNISLRQVNAAHRALAYEDYLMYSDQRER